MGLFKQSRGHKVPRKVSQWCFDACILCCVQTLLRIHYDLKQQQLQGEVDVPCTHFLETGSSLLHEMPWVLHKDYQVSAMCT